MISCKLIACSKMVQWEIRFKHRPSDKGTYGTKWTGYIWLAKIDAYMHEYLYLSIGMFIKDVYCSQKVRDIKTFKKAEM